MTLANVRMIDLANGGVSGRGRFAGRAPDFRSVAQFESGRPRMIANNYEETERPDPGSAGSSGFFGGN